MTIDDLQAIKVDLTTALSRVDALILSMRQEQADERSSNIDVTQLPRTRAIEWALTQQDGPLRPVEIWAALRAAGRNDPKMEVQVTTYDLWQRGRIDKVDRGLYRAAARTTRSGRPAL